MGDFNKTLQEAALAVLKRELTEDERVEFLDLAGALGMGNVEDYLYMLMVFKRHEDRLNRRFDDMAVLSKRIDETLTDSIERILGEGAKRIGADMGNEIAEEARGVLTSFGEYQTLRGHTILAGFLCLTFALAYRLGKLDVLSAAPPRSTLEAFLLLPAGWSVFFCGATYTFLWTGDHWNTIKRRTLYKTLFGVQVFFLTLLGLGLL
jgi:hypothetical protein